MAVRAPRIKRREDKEIENRRKTMQGVVCASEKWGP